MPILLGNLYRALGGQPKRVGSPDRMIQLAARALAQGGHMDALLKQAHEKDQKALAALLQAGGIAVAPTPAEMGVTLHSLV